MRKMILLLLAVMIPCGATAHAALTANGNGTVTDSRTGLIWQQGEPGVKTWGSALSYCEGLDLGDATSWRLPNVKELESLTDDTRWNPAIDTDMFPNAIASYYWSSSSYASNPYGAWYVSFYSGGVSADDKSYPLYVRCVRGGQSGSFGNLNPTIAMMPMAAPAGTTFAEWGTGFTPNGNATLHFFNPAGAEILPALTQPLDGDGHFDISYLSPPIKPPGPYSWFAVDDASGKKSNEVTYMVTPAQIGVCSGSVEGYVKDQDGNALDGAVVTLSQGKTVRGTLTTSANGKYSFSSLDCTGFQLLAEYGARKSISLPVTINGRYPAFKDIKISLCENGKIPVILIPGNPGSTKSGAGRWKGWIPKLPATCPAEDLQLHDPTDKPGWRNLKDVLQYEFTVIDCPWDWRVPPEYAAEHYLKPMIAEAAKCSPTGKVYVVAHSMGGLVTRAYIQGSNYNYDIEKFAMVGTPNKGSANTYYIWEGGDPVTIDDMVTPWIEEINIWSNYYTDTIRELWRVTYNKDGWDSDDYIAIKSFVQSKSPSLRYLMATWGDLLSDPAQGNISWGVSTKGNENTWLIKLNNDSSTDRMSRDGANNTVKVGLFAGASEQTIGQIKARYGSSWPSGRYEDGVPRGQDFRSISGDRTVPLTSALYPATVGWAETMKPRVAKHSDLIDVFKEEICSFLKGGACATGWYADMRLSANTAADGPAPIAGLSFGVNGAMRLHVTDPSGYTSGVDPLTGEVLEGIPGAEIAFDYDGGVLSVPSPAAGIYVVKAFGQEAGDFSIDLSYLDAATGTRLWQQGYFSINEYSFMVILDPAAAQPVVLVPEIPAVTGLEATPQDNGDLITRLNWDANGHDDLSGYAVYARVEGDYSYTKIGDVEATVASFDTNYPWRDEASVPVVNFAVTAIDASGHESFFPKTVRNNDRDGDGLPDVEEAAFGSDINNPDTDGDGLDDRKENQRGTNPTLSDTDGDSYSDAIEVQTGSDPLDPLSPPHAVQDAISTPEDTPVTIPVLANDLGAIGVTLAIGSVVQQPSYGTVAVSETGIIYTPAANWSGIVAFTYTATDGVVAGNAATVTVTVTAVNDAPTLGTITPSAATTTYGTAQAFSAVYSDLDGYADIATAQFDVGDGALNLSAKYDQAANKLWLKDDAGTSWIGGCAPGSAGTIANTRGTVNCAATAASGAGNELTVNWNITPAVGFASMTARTLYLGATDSTEATTGLIAKGTWTIALPTVTITANDATATEAGPTTGQYTVTRTGPTTAELTVVFAVTGTATSGSDYTNIGASVTIPAAAASATITVTPINDTAVESDETVIVTLSANAAYVVGTPASATVTITSDDVALPTSWVGSVTITSDRNVVAVGRPHIGSEVASYDGFPAGALSAYLPMLFKNAFGGSYDSAFYVQNVQDTNAANLVIKYYNSAGSLNCTVNDTVAPLASKGYWVPNQSCLPIGWVGGVVIASDQPIVAIGRPHVGAEVMTYGGFSEGSLTSYLPMLFKDAFGGSYDSAFYVQNVDAANTANLTIDFYDNAGALSCTKAGTVAPLASRGYWLPSESCLPTGWVGGVVVTSDQPIVTVGRPHIGAQITTYNGFSSGAFSSYLPMLFKGAFGGAYNAAFYVQNVDNATTANLAIEYYDSSGTLNCTVIDTVAAFASKGYWVPNQTCLPAGWAGGVVVTSDQPIVAVGRPHIGAQVTTYNGFTSGSMNAYLPMLFKAAFGGSYNSAFYVQNTEASVANVMINFYNSSGALTCTRIDTIPPLSILGLWLPSLTCSP